MLDKYQFLVEPKLPRQVEHQARQTTKFAPDSSQIRIHFSRQLEFVLVEVIDKGAGIAQEKLPFIFDRCFQVDNKGSKYSGLGLGLYICAEIIKRHNGEIGANSSPGNGSTFWFKLPLN